MLVFFTVLSIVISTLFALVMLMIYFSEDISAYIQAKTEQLKAMTELIRKEKEREHAE